MKRAVINIKAIYLKNAVAHGLVLITASKMLFVIMLIKNKEVRYKRMSGRRRLWSVNVEGRRQEIEVSLEQGTRNLE